MDPIFLSFSPYTEITTTVICISPLHVWFGKTTNFQLNVNGNVHGPLIENSKQPYCHLYKMLHLTHEESLPFSYNKYKDGYAIPQWKIHNLKFYLLKQELSYQ